MEIEDCKLIDGWFIVNPYYDPIDDDWYYKSFGTNHSLSNAHKIYISYRPERLNPEDRCKRCNCVKEVPCRNCLLDEALD